MEKDIFQAVNPLYIQKLFQRKKNLYFPSFKKNQIKEIKIEKISPDWAKETCLAKYVVFFSQGKKKILRGTAKTSKLKRGSWKLMKYLKQKGLKIAKPVDYIEKINLLIYEEVPGIPLAVIIEKGDFLLSQKNIKRVAFWITKFHNIKARVEMSKALFLGSKEYMRIMKLVKKLMPQEKNLIPNKKLKFVDEIWKFKKTIIHNDLYFGNIVIEPESLSVIDFDLSGFGPPLMDVATIYGSLEFPKEIWPIKMKLNDIKILQELFLKTYCQLNDLSYKKTIEELKLFLAKIFLDQVHYYAAFTVRGWEFMNQKQRKDYLNKVKKLLLKTKEYLPI